MNKSRNPISGRNCTGLRFRFHVPSISRRLLYLPLEMKSLTQIRQLIQGKSPLSVFECRSIDSARRAFSELRRNYDFDYWAATEYFVRDLKDADNIVPLYLNDCQHHVIDIIRRRFFLRLQSRYIISKSSRRIGLSTCIQAYILWMQTFQRSNNSYTCGPSEISIHPLKSNLCRHLNRDVIPSDMGVFLPRVGWCAYFNTFRNPDAIRGINLGYVHLADMSRWKDPDSKKSVRAYTAPASAVLLDYLTLVVLEGDVPKRKCFSIKGFIRKHPKEKDAIRIRKLSKTFCNPFFINNVMVATTSSDPHFLHINIPTFFGKQL